MKQKEKYKMNKKICWLILFIVFLLFILSIFSLNQYLHEIRKKDRLSSLERLDNFTMTISKENRCQTREIMTFEDHKLIYYCIDEVRIHYGDIYIPLKEAISSGYVNLETLLSHTIREENGFYRYQNSRTQTEFYILVTSDAIYIMPDSFSKQLFLPL